MNKEPIIILRDIIKTQLSLTDQDLWLYNQDFKIPQTSGLFVVLEKVNSTTFANNNRFVENDTEDGINEVQTINNQDKIAIELFSKDRTAQTRQDEVKMALNSYFARQQYEIYQFRVAKINNPFINISAAEGTGMLSRFRLTVTVLSWTERIAAVPFYDSNFTATVKTDPELQ